MAIQYKKKRKIILPIITICMLFILIIILILYISKKTAEYQYANKIFEYELPTDTTPTKTEIVISYGGEKPIDVNIKINSATYLKYLSDYDVEYDDEGKKIYITYDIIPNGESYILQVKPADNESIKVDIAKEVSALYVNGGISSEINEDGEEIITVVNYNEDEEITISMIVESNSRDFSKSIDSIVLQPNSEKTITLSDYQRDYPQADKLIINLVDDSDKKSIRKVFNW